MHERKLSPPVKTTSDESVVETNPPPPPCSPETPELGRQRPIGQPNQLTRSEKLRRLEEAIVLGQQEIRQLFAASVARAIRIGDCLNEVKLLLNHGEFERWHQNNLVNVCGMSLRTAQRYMRLAKKKDELVTRARSVYTGGKLARIEDQEVLGSLKISEAVNLLALPSSRPIGDEQKATEKDREGGPDEDMAFEQTLAELTAKLMDRLGSPSNDAINGLPQNPLVIPSIGSRPSQTQLKAADSASESTETVCNVIALTDSTSPQWLGLLDDFPRVYVRQGAANENSKSATVGVIVGVVPPSRFSDFVDVFAHLGAAFIPARATEFSNQTHQPRSTN